MAKLRNTPENRFWSKVQKTEACWIWVGAVTSTGYGVFQKGRRGEKLHKAHRFSFELHNGPIPHKALILHSCDNKLCVNPQHLSVGNHSQNLQEAWDRGLRVMSEKNKYRLADSQILKRMRLRICDT